MTAVGICVYLSRIFLLLENQSRNHCSAVSLCVNNLFELMQLSRRKFYKFGKIVVIGLRPTLVNLSLFNPKSSTVYPVSFPCGL